MVHIACALSGTNQLGKGKQQHNKFIMEVILIKSVCVSAKAMRQGSSRSLRENPDAYDYIQLVY